MNSVLKDMQMERVFEKRRNTKKDISIEMTSKNSHFDIGLETRAIINKACRKFKGEM